MREQLFTLGYLSIVAAFFTAAVSAVHIVTQGRVELNQELAERRVVMDVLGIELPKGADLAEVKRAYDRHVSRSGVTIETETGAVPVLEGRDDEGKLTGYAFRLAGQGFWDVVEGYVAVAPDLRTILGISFFRQNETPGLGGEITKEWFTGQFEGKEIPPEPGPEGRLIRLVGPGMEAGSHDVHAITGATGTSTAVERLLNRTLRSFLEAMEGRGDG